jgi:general secretion pathway protein A
LQIILSGQPELDEIIDSPDMPQLKQRIALRCRLQGLRGSEIEAYILQRLQTASSNPQRRADIFSKPAIDAIERYSHGIPRLVNTLCENSLASGYANGLSVINGSIVEEVARQFGFRATEEMSLTNHCFPPSEVVSAELFSEPTAK